jgi:hypothetical protein
VPFTGSCKQDPDKDSYNVYLFQLKIQIEMSFGLLTTKWCILRRKLEMSLENSARIIEACARMHNYVLNWCKGEDEDEDSPPEDKPDIHVMAGSPLGWDYLPTIDDFNSLPGTSCTLKIRCCIKSLEKDSSAKVMTCDELVMNAC